MKLDLTQFPLMGDQITQKLFKIFSNEGVFPRFVGGCVRDAVLGIAAQDIDIAVPISPDDIIYILTKDDVNVIPTGYEFGTVTAVIDGRPFQITSLREDWETDGRHPRVTFGKDWEVDASRRDFTINALYADENGSIYDYFNGLDDLNLGVVRFVGDAHKRIQEDYLRILRYFRFLAWYGHGPVHVEAMHACTAHGEGLAGLSKERIGHEFLKLLAAPDPQPSLVLMTKTQVIPFILPHPMNLEALKALLSFDKETTVLCRLAALSLPEIDATALGKALRLSRDQKHYLHRCQERLEHYPSSERTLSRNLYFDGVDLFQDFTMISLTTRPLSSTPDILEEAFKRAASWNPPTFPVQGKDLVNLGLKPGPKLGDLLKRCESWWIDQEFLPDQASCLKWIEDQEQ